MAENPIPIPLPADLPTNWIYGQTVAPTGAEAGLATQYGYNYLMAAVNAAQSAINTIGAAFLNLATTGDLSALSSTVSGLDSDLSALQSALNSLNGIVNAHIASKDNPHEVTAAQVGAGFLSSGSYVGTGVYGPDNPNILTFDFDPKAVFIGAYYTTPGMGSVSTYYYYTFGVLIGNVGFVCSLNAAYYLYFYPLDVVNEGGTISWNLSKYGYAFPIGASSDRDKSPRGQLNQSEVTYNYIAIG